MFECNVCLQWPFQPHIGIPIERDASCQHILCGICAKSLLTDKCPACRTAVRFVAEKGIGSPMDKETAAKCVAYAKLLADRTRSGRFKMAEAIRVCADLELFAHSMPMTTAEQNLMTLAVYHDYVVGNGDGEHLRRVAAYANCELVCVPTTEALSSKGYIYAQTQRKPRQVGDCIVRANGHYYRVIIIGTMPALHNKTDTVESVLFPPAAAAPVMPKRKRARKQ